ncbi:NACHT domain-containing protein [Streptomyces flavofungini]|uniref:NACHT domain-containing protein n=1 Tax=Streptomyces flavofungini TaxID=68200 RepID=UPI0025B1C420|nr:NACHT domain-containing protein [Streptomyces flavofungini]WJV45183.1 NACHT domain-containing protein [Streptomyces flavofungini]
MDAGTVGLRIASSVMVPLVKRLLLPPKSLPGAEFGERPVRIGRLLSFTGDRRVLSEADLYQLARELVRRAMRAAGPHDPPIAPDEQNAVGYALGHTLRALGELDMDDVQAYDLGPEKLAAALVRASAPETRALLSTDAARLHDRLLVTACLHLVHQFSKRPGFEARTQVELRRSISEQKEQLRLLLERLPATLAEDTDFEQTYADYVVRRHSSLTIHGVDLHDPQSQAWPLETAYLSLEAAPARDPAEQVPGAGNGDPDGRGADPDPESERTAGPVEAALAAHDRVLLRGVAGTGKTTLVQWIAITTAQQDRVPGHLPQLLGRVPFVLPLRTLAREDTELPMPDGFLKWIDCPLTGSEPKGWAVRVLQAGRGMLLIDGVDEIPEAERPRARAWLAKLHSAFPGNLWLVTTRPSALPRDWLGREGFREFTLTPMRPGDVRRFVRRWHEAAGAGEELAGKLLPLLRASPELSRLSTNPLLCSLMCALHRERRGFLPPGRIALYEAALSMLLERRDRERDLYGRKPPPLDQMSATEPLKRLAYWLIRNERTILRRQDAVDLIERLRPSVPQLATVGTSDDVLRLLLVRTGLLREPAEGAVDFIHRTFQDFLGAKAALEEHDIGVLVAHAHVDQWEDVLQMAVAQARPDERADLLTRLTGRADREEDDTVRARLRLLALASLGQATRLDPEVRRTVEERAAQLLPPRSMREARALAETGALLLGLLPGADTLTGDAEVTTVHAICRIGGDAALTRLREFVTTRQPAVRSQLLAHWDRFDTDMYAEEIIKPLLAAGAGEAVTVRSAAELKALSAMSGYERVVLQGDFTDQEILGALDTDRLRELRLRGNMRLTSLGFLSAFPALEALALHGCRAISDTAPLTRLPLLRRLTLTDLPQLEPLARLSACPRLDSLLLGAAVPWRGLRDLPRPSALRLLALPPDAVELNAITALTELRELRLHNASDRLRPDDWDALLAELPALRTLRLSHEQLSMMLFPPGARIPQLTGLDVRSRPGAAVSLRRIARRLPGLEEVHLSLFDTVDLVHLAGLPALRRVRLDYPGEVHHADELPARVELTVRPRH